MKCDPIHPISRFKATHYFSHPLYTFARRKLPFYFLPTCIYDPQLLQQQEQEQEQEQQQQQS